MASRRRVIALGLLGLGVAVLLAGLVLLRLVNSGPFGTGESQPSPDQRHMAAVHEYFATDFWSGEKQHWFEFEVTGPGVAYRARTAPIPARLSARARITASFSGARVRASSALPSPR